MKMSDLRVKVDSRHFELYNDMTEVGAVTEAHVLFFSAACVGFRHKRRLQPIRRNEKFWSRTFTQDEWTCFYSLALSHWEGQFDRIQDDKAVIELMEEYATGGIDVLVESTLSEYLLSNTREPRLDKSRVSDLPKILVWELWQMSDANIADFYESDFKLSMKRSTTLENNPTS